MVGELTPRQLVREVVVARRAALERRILEIWSAWHTAVLQRASTMPQLEELLQRLRGPQSPAEQLARWRHIGETFGRVRRHNPRRVRIVRPHG